MGLPRPLRLTRRRDYAAVRERGRTQRGRLLWLGVLADPEVPRVSAGFIVPKALGDAVQRNRTKRRLREIVRHALPWLQPHLRLVTLARRGALEAGHRQLEEEWLWLARRAGVLERHSLEP